MVYNEQYSCESSSAFEFVVCVHDINIVLRFYDTFGHSWEQTSVLEEFLRIRLTKEIPG